MSALVIGIGNPDRGDDGIGLAVARRVAEIAPAGVDVVEGYSPAALMDIWIGADPVVVVDAITSGRDPGTVLTLDATAGRLPIAVWAAGGTHAVGLSATVELARALGDLPRRLVVVGVEVSPRAPIGAGLTAEVAAAIEPAARAALTALGVTAR